MDKKSLASKILGVGKNRVKFANNREEIDQAITREDMRRLIARGDITVDKVKGVSRSRAKKQKEQQKKGRRRGQGNRKGTANSRTPGKRTWINKVRKQRGFIKELKEKEYLENKDYKKLYRLVKGGFFRNKKHLKTFVNERGLIQNGKK